MTSCTDRQIAQSLREAAFSQTRGGVARAVRPFSGAATPENLVDYINREMFPAVKQARDKVNDIFLQVADNAPSANPLTYFFDIGTGAANNWVFDGVDDRVEISNVLDKERTDQFSVTGWAKTTTLGRDIFRKYVTSPSVRGYAVQVSLGGKLRFALSNTANTNVLTVETSVAVNTGVEFHFAVVYTGTSTPAGVTIYVNGVSQALVTVDNNLSATTLNTGTLTIGVFGAGTLRHIAMWGDDLSAAEQLETYNAGSPPNLLATSMATDLQYWAKLDGVDSDDPGGVIDHSVNGFNGTALGGLGAGSGVLTTATGRAGLDGTPQDSSTLLRVSEINSLRANVATWLTVMDGGVTSPIGVVTVTHAKTPARFIRFNLTDVVDRGTYWDLTVVAVESSHDNPFADGDPILVSFIPGVASGGAAPIATLKQVGLVSHIGGNSVTGVSRLAFQNSNNVTWSLSTAANAATVLASVNAAPAAFSLVSLAGSQSGSVTNATDALISTGTVALLSASDTNHSAANVQFRMSGNTLMGAASIAAIAGTLAVGSCFAPAFALSNSNNVSFGASTLALAGVGRLVRITASVTVASTQASIQISAGTTNTLASAFSIANSNNVSFTLNGATLNASATVASTQASINFAAAGVTNLLSNLTFSNSNNVSFGLAGSVLTATATVAATREIGIVSHIGGNVVSSVSQLAFSNASNVTFSLSTAAGAATLIASVAAGGGGGITAFALSNAASSVMATGLTFSNANGFSFLLSTAAGNAATLSGSFSTHALAVSAAGASASAGTVVWSNSNNVSFGQAGSTITASVTVASTQASIRISAGTTNNLISNFSFANGSGVSFGINGSTITASVDAAAGGGIALAAGTQTATSGTVLFSSLGTALTGAAALALTNNVMFDMSASSIVRATAVIRVGDNLNATDTAGSGMTKIVFNNANGITFNAQSTSNADGRFVQLTASYAPLAISAPGNSVSAGTVNLTIFPAGDGRNNLRVNAEMAGSQLSMYYDPPRLGGQWNGITGAAFSNYSSFHNRPYLFQPFKGAPLVPFGRGNDLSIGDWYVGQTFDSTRAGVGTTVSNSNYSLTVRIGLYSVVSGTAGTLTLVNSASRTFSASSNSQSNLMQGPRWLKFNQTDWSAATGLSAGQYWVALLASQGSSNDPRGAFHGDANAGFLAHSGLVGVANVANSRGNPFGGYVTFTTGALPASFVSSNLQATSAASAALMAFIPALSVQALMAGAWG